MNPAALPGSPKPRQISNLSNAAYDQLLNLIVRGQLAPGTPLSETELVRRLGMSRTPIRTALHRLQQERLVLVSHQGQGARIVVAPLTANDVTELFNISGVLEGYAARMAARLEAPARHSLVERMDALQVKLRAAVAGRRPDVAQAQILHSLFHRSYVEAVSGPRLLAELDRIHPQTERYGLGYTVALTGGFGPSFREHEAIIRAIRAGDARGAERWVSDNWRNGGERYRRAIEALGERGSW